MARSTFDDDYLAGLDRTIEWMGKQIDRRPRRPGAGAEGPAAMSPIMFPAWIAFDDATRAGHCVRCGASLVPRSDDETTPDLRARVFREHAGCAVDQAEIDARAARRAAAIARSPYPGDAAEAAEASRARSRLVAPGASALTRAAGVVGATVAQAAAMTAPGSHAARVAAARAVDGSVPVGILCHLFGALGHRLGYASRARDAREAVMSGALGIAAAELLDLIGDPASATTRAYKATGIEDPSRSLGMGHDIESGGRPLDIRSIGKASIGPRGPTFGDLASGDPDEIRRVVEQLARLAGIDLASQPDRREAIRKGGHRPTFDPRAVDPRPIPAEAFAPVPAETCPIDPIGPRWSTMSMRETIPGAARVPITFQPPIPIVGRRLHLTRACAERVLVSATHRGHDELFRDLPGELMCEGGIALRSHGPDGVDRGGVPLHPAMPLSLSVENLSLASVQVVLTLFYERADLPSIYGSGVSHAPASAPEAPVSAPATGAGEYALADGTDRIEADAEMRDRPMADRPEGGGPYR